MQIIRFIVGAAVALAWSAAATAAVVPSVGNFLTAWQGGIWNFIGDGSVRPVAFTENTRFAICLDRIDSPLLPSAISDGTSNTLVFSETAPVEVIPGAVRPRQPIQNLLDGTSNTVLFDEAPADALCFEDTRLIDPPGEIVDGTSNTIQFGEDSRFDACLSNIRVGIVDSASNTILFGEETAGPVCFDQVRIAPGAVLAEAPEPAAIALLGIVLTGLGLARARRGRALTQI